MGPWAGGAGNPVGLGEISSLMSPLSTAPVGHPCPQAG